jgi:hypothetical protein
MYSFISAIRTVQMPEAPMLVVHALEVWGVVASSIKQFAV